MDVTIRPLKEEDAKTSVAWRNDPEVFRLTGVRRYDNVVTVEMEKTWIRKVMADPTCFRCAILADGEYVGNIYLTDIDESEATYHIFIGNKSYWGKGVASAATKQILEYGFRELRLSRIKLRVRNENERAVNLYRNTGFRLVDKDEEYSYMVIGNS